jgi:hypothetical protein
MGFQQRTLATVLFTDIVGSSERAPALGDRGWGGAASRGGRRNRTRRRRVGPTSSGAASAPSADRLWVADISYLRPAFVAKQ